MNEQERIFFEALSQDREESASTLEKPSMRGIQKSVVEKYSDQAHFIYELLQNANDAQATYARFILEPTRLIFAHNGKRLFSISNPKNEERDLAQGKLGDVNAITSIAQSNKTSASIGKFGVGFKAVFQYTSTPHIYDPHFKFRIERFIVPKPLKRDFPGRKSKETLFVFPFDHPGQAYNDIADKLKNLSYPLLFLTKLESIDLEIGQEIGFYGKKIIKEPDFKKTKAQHIRLIKWIMGNKEDQTKEEDLWLFSEVDENNYKYCVGFFLDKEGKVCSKREPAFCFFPTKEFTGLNFIIHAPFLLTDSREGILAGEFHNQKMIDNLAKLAARSFQCLKSISHQEGRTLMDDNVWELIPYHKDNFSGNNRNKISFLPFYETILRLFQTEKILPTQDGYAYAAEAYWASTAALPKLFSNEHLREIANNPRGSWIFTTKNRDAIREGNLPLANYIDRLGVTHISDMDIIKGWAEKYDRPRGQGITAPFIEKQSFDWLTQFYKWINSSSTRRNAILNKPIFWNQNRKAVAPFKDKALNLFLPSGDISVDYNFVHSSLLQNEEASQLLKAIGIKVPSKQDYIQSVLLPSYKDSYQAISDSQFKILFDFYCESSRLEAGDLIQSIKPLFIFESENSYLPRVDRASDLYFPSQELKKFFKPSVETRFLAFQKYLKLVGEGRKDDLQTFFEELGVKKEPCRSRRIYGTSKGEEYQEEETYIYGLDKLIKDVEEKKNLAYSAYLWDTLCRLVEKGTLSSEVLYLKRKNSKKRSGGFQPLYDKPSPTATALKTRTWLANFQKKFCQIQDLTLEDLNFAYRLEQPGAQSLISLLGIQEASHSNLTKEQRKKIEIANQLQRELGLTEITDSFLRDLREFQQAKQKSKEKANTSKSTSSSSRSTPLRSKQEIDENSFNEIQGRPMSSRKRKVMRDILQYSESHSASFSVEDDSDQDEYLLATVDYNQRIQKAKERSAQKINQIIHLEELYDQAKSKSRYSFGWFKVLLELEKLKSLEENRNQKEFTIRFAKVEREPGTLRTLILKHPNRPIPQFIEDLGDIMLVLEMDQTTKTVPIEVSSIHSYTLRVKIKKSVRLEEIDFSTVHLATIEVKSPVFLLEKLQEAFEALDYVDGFNMHQNLPKNIEFVFGPPGTGKTTHIVTHYILPLMEEKRPCKVLVLTPTNKAADVLVNKIIEKAPASYEDWLVRFGSTGDEDIEQNSIFVEKNFDIKNAFKNVTITTIARFPYDFFQANTPRFYLKEVNWDYIIVDEASMVSLAHIIYPLYKRNPRKFIIAGDPFQIQPITAIDLWKEENIYTLVGLNSFKAPKTKPHEYKVIPLETQYRSIEDIGKIFSQFSYDGILKHHRPSQTQKNLYLKEGPKIAPLNIIKFPVSPYESIYRSKKLQRTSPYHIYCALFTHEFVSYLSNLIAQTSPGKLFTIGVIAPYRAQADLIDKLIATKIFPKEIEVQVGTIHGFQGDECDMILVVLNTPPTISSSKNMFLNNPNIINVAISRAKDYLFVLMPDDNTHNITKLTQIKKLEKLIKSSGAWIEYSTLQLESIMFGNPRFLENHSFSTSHQDVNVYGLPEKIYEIRTEENAIDLQIHQPNESLVSTSTNFLTSPVSVSKSSSPSTNSISTRTSSLTNSALTSMSSATDPASKSTNSSTNPASINISSPTSSTSKSTSTSPSLASKIDEDKDLIVNIRNSKGKLIEFYLVPYSGKINQYTDEKLAQRFIFPFAQHKDAPKYATVWVDLNNKTLFISKFIFNIYKWFFIEAPYLELCKSRPRV